MNRGGEILRPVSRGCALKDANVNRNIRIRLAVHSEEDVIWAKMILEQPLLVRFPGHAEDEAGAFESFHRRLIVEVERADRLHFIIEEFQPQRLFRLPGEEIDDATTPGELPPLGHDRHTLVAVFGKLAEQLFHIHSVAHLNRAPMEFHLLPMRSGLAKAVRTEDKAVRSIHVFHPSGEDGEAFGSDIGVLHRVAFDLRSAHARVVERGCLPNRQLGVELVLLLGIGAKNPDAPARMSGFELLQNHRRNECETVR